MPLRKHEPRPAAAIGSFQITAHVYEQAPTDDQGQATGPAVPVITLRYQLDILDAAGAVLERQAGDVREDLGAQRAQRLEEIALAMYAKAQAKVLRGEDAAQR